MTLRNFDDEPTPPPKLTPQHKAVLRPCELRYLLVPEEDWTGRELQDYVLSKITEEAQRSQNEGFIFRGFMIRWGDKAVAIAKYAFEIAGGYWHGKDVGPFMFQKGYDPYFAEEIAKLLEIR